MEKEKLAQENEDKNHKDVLSRIIDKIFEIREIKFYLIVIFLLGFILRLIAAINLSVAADDMHHVTHAINFLGSGRLITYDQSSGLWQAFMSIMYDFFGTTQLSSRLAALIFGSFSTFVIFLLTKEFFSERIAFLAAFLLAIAPFHIMNTIAEQDVMAMFFVLLGMFLFIRGIKFNKSFNFAFGGIFFGLAIYTKVYPLLFLPSLFLYFIYYKRKAEERVFSKSNVKKISIFLLAAFIFAIPALAHNYLLYKDKSFLDLQFTRTLGLGKEISAQYYAWDGQFNAKNSWRGLIFGDTNHIADGTPLLLGAVDFIRLEDPINFYLGIVGFVLILFYRKEYRPYTIFFILSILFVLLFLASIILLPKHFIFLEIFLIPMGALAITEANNKIAGISKKNSIQIILIITLIIALISFGLPDKYSVRHFYGKSYIAQIIDFKEKNIGENELMISDSRIYRGNINWYSQGRPYLEGTAFIQVINQQDQLQGEPVQMNLYYIECVIDDCGWGTVSGQPEFNASMESLTQFFIERGELIKTITEPNREKVYYPLFTNKNKREMIRIYKATLPLKQTIIDIGNQPKEWFLYTIGYQPMGAQFDYYQTYGFFDTFLDRIAHWIVWLAVILAFVSPFYVIYLLYKNE